MNESTQEPFERPAALGELFGVFLKLGLTSFGGPIAHLGYFRNELVLRRHWIDEAGYADTVALCQFLPGPASSQVGFALGIKHGNGLLGGLAAWLGFTLPSALILFGFALVSSTFGGPLVEGFLHGLKLVAVSVVAQALLGMAHALTPDLRRVGIAFVAVMLIVMLGGAFAQIAAIFAGALLGLAICNEANGIPQSHLHYPISRHSGTVALVLFVILLVLLPLVAVYRKDPLLELFDAFYRSGALVFGGGHVILPLLQEQVVASGWVSNATFLNGYGLAQAIPGPLSTFAAYLGALAEPAPSPYIGAVVALLGIFLPGLLLVYGALPFWDALRVRPRAQTAMRGANAAVVGILAVAFVNPVCSIAITRWSDVVLAFAGFLLLARWRVPSWVVVVLLAIAGIVLAAMHD